MPTIGQFMGAGISRGSAGLCYCSALQAAQGALDKFLQYLGTAGTRHSRTDELPVDADQKERGTVVRVDVVVELAADACPLDLGGQQ